VIVHESPLVWWVGRRKAVLELRALLSRTIIPSATRNQEFISAEWSLLKDPNDGLFFWVTLFFLAIGWELHLVV
jgi:hypothetical protein